MLTWGSFRNAVQSWLRVSRSRSRACSKSGSALHSEPIISAAEHLYAQPFMALLHQAHLVLRAHFNPNRVQVSTLLSLKTGGCPEDCRYCAQSAHYAEKGARASAPWLSTEIILQRAKQAKEAGCSRFCMSAAWRHLSHEKWEVLCALIEQINALGLETCMSLGSLTETQAARLRAAGLCYYNHNLDTSASFYSEVVTTRTYDDRLRTIRAVQAAGLKLCCGGILGLGEQVSDRLALLVTLSQLTPPPASIPINQLVPIPGTPLENAPPVPWVDLIRTIAVARILIPTAYLRLAAGRDKLSEALQAMAIYAGANAIFYGEKLLTVNNVSPASDSSLFAQLGLQAEAPVPDTR